VTTKRATYQVIYIPCHYLLRKDKHVSFHAKNTHHRITELQNITLHFHCSIKTMLLTKVICQLMYNIVKKTLCMLSEE